MASRINVFYSSESFQSDKIRENLAVYQTVNKVKKIDTASLTTDVKDLQDFLFKKIIDDLTFPEKSFNIEYLKTQIISAYKNALSNCRGVHRAFVKFSLPESDEYGRLDCDFYFFVSRSLFFNIDLLYKKTDQIRDYFEDELDVNIFYHYAIYHGQDLEEDIREEAREIYIEQAEVSTASQF